jgi:alcohol dehydrogenase class IV
LNTSFEFATATRIIFGAGSLRQAGPLTAGFGRRALIVTGRDARRAEPLLAQLRSNGVASLTFPIAGEPHTDAVIQGTALARNEGCNVVIGFGGGSAVDAAKAIAAMAANDGDLLDYLEVIGRAKPLAAPSLPFLAIPTTAGTGAEATRNAVLASPQHRVKVSLRSPLMLARAAIIDPELTHDLPPALTASTGLDALTQLIEPFVCSRANPMTDALCVQALPRVARSLPRAFRDGRDTAAREDMALASLFGGLALANAGLGAVHGFAAPIGGRFPAPHGAVCAALLALVMEANLKALHERQPNSEALSRYEQVARHLTGNHAARPEHGIEWVRLLVSEFKIPSLGAYGITREHVAELAQKASQASSMKANPIALSQQELSGILNAAL